MSDITRELLALVHRPNPTNPNDWRVAPGSGKAFAQLMNRVYMEHQPRHEQSPEPFVVKHYAGMERPCIKGNGFDGTPVGIDRQDAEELVAWINKRISEVLKGRMEGLAK